MGLDQYGFARKSGHQDIEIMYWRKHANLEGWMAGLYRERGGKKEFNCVELKLTEGNLNALAMNVKTLKNLGFSGENPPKAILLIQNSLSKRQGNILKKVMK